MTKHFGVVGACLAAVLGLASSSAAAHITLETSEAPVGASYKAVLRVPHGCDGAATIKLRVQVPEGLLTAKPMPKPGWVLETVKGKYAGAYTVYGAKVSEGVKEIIWTGKLPDDEYDEFVFVAFLADNLKPGDMLYVPVVQECEQGVACWIEIPEPGKSEDDYEHPAPGLKLLPNTGQSD